MSEDILGAIAAFLFVIGLIYLLAWVIRRFGLVPGQPAIRLGEKQLELLETQAVDPRSRLVLARWKDTIYLLGVGQNGVQLIDKAHDERSDDATENRYISVTKDIIKDKPTGQD